MRVYEVGDIVCCCDLKHREISRICEETGDLEMTDGGIYDPVHCVDPVKPDGSCHSDYYMNEEGH